MVPHNQHFISALQRQASRRLSVRGQRERGKDFFKNLHCIFLVKFTFYFYFQQENCNDWYQCLVRIYLDSYVPKGLLKVVSGVGEAGEDPPTYQ